MNDVAKFAKMKKGRWHFRVTALCQIKVLLKQKTSDSNKCSNGWNPLNVITLEQFKTDNIK
jgi:hypothetical protein